MDDKITVITNHHERKVISGFELSESERKDFDYIDWKAVEEGSDSVEFVKYRGEIHDLGEFTIAPRSLKNWDEYQPDSYFSGLLVRWARNDRGEIDSDYVVMGRYYT